MPEMKEQSVKKIATRESYGSALAELGKLNDKIVVLDADLAAATKTGVFKKVFPERHIDCGIAECNMMGIPPALLQQAWFHLQAPSPCSQPVERSNRLETPSDTRI